MFWTPARSISFDEGRGVSRTSCVSSGGLAAILLFENRRGVPSVPDGITSHAVPFTCDFGVAGGLPGPNPLLFLTCPRMLVVVGLAQDSSRLSQIPCDALQKQAN